MPGPAVTVEGLKGMAAQLKAMDRETRKRFQAELREMAEESAVDARGAAQGGTTQQARAAYNVVGSGSAAGGSVVVSSGNSIPYALGAFWGAKRPQFPGLPWVGKSWAAGVHGEGPYFINDAIADDADMFERDFPFIIEKIAKASRAFPD